MCNRTSSSLWQQDYPQSGWIHFTVPNTHRKTSPFAASPKHQNPTCPSSGRKAITNVECFQVSRLAGPHTQWGPWPNLRPQLNQSRCERCSKKQVCQIRSLSSKWTHSWEAIHIHWLYYSIHIQCMCIRRNTYWNIPSGNMLSVISHLFSTYKSTQVLFSFVWKYIYAFTCTAMMDLLRDLDLAASDIVGRRWTE